MARCLNGRYDSMAAWPCMPSWVDFDGGVDVCRKCLFYT